MEAGKLRINCCKALAKVQTKNKQNRGMGKSRLCQGVLSPLCFSHCRGSRFLRSGRLWATALGSIIFRDVVTCVTMLEPCCQLRVSTSALVGDLDPYPWVFQF